MRARRPAGGNASREERVRYERRVVDLVEELPLAETTFPAEGDGAGSDAAQGDREMAECLVAVAHGG